MRLRNPFIFLWPFHIRIKGSPARFVVGQCAAAKNLLYLTVSRDGKKTSEEKT